MAARGPRARPRRHARLHGRVGPRHRRRRADREPLRPRRPRRQPPPRRGPLGGRRARGRRPAPAERAGLGVARDEREALPHPRRGLLGRPAPREDDARRRLATAPHPVVAILDSERAGRAPSRGSRSSRASREALAFGPTAALVGVALDRRALPPAWRAILERAVERRTRRRGGHARVPRGRRRARRLARADTASSCATCAARRPTSASRPARTSRTATVVLTVGSDCAIGKKTMALELDLEASARGLRSVFVPTGQTGIMIAGWGIAVDAVVADFVAGRRRAARRRGREARRPALGRGTGLAGPPALLGRHARALPRRRAARCSSSATRPGDRRSRAARAPDPAALRARRAPRADGAAGAPGAGRRRSRSTRAASTRRRRARAIAAAEAETGLVADDPVRFGAGRGSSTRCSSGCRPHAA